MASKPDERRCFIDYLPSLLLLWGLLFFQQDISAQEDPDIFVEISPDSLIPNTIGTNETTLFTVTVGNKGGDLLPYQSFLVEYDPDIDLDVEVNGVKVIDVTRNGILSSGRTFSRTFEIEGPVAVEVSVNVEAYYDRIILKDIPVDESDMENNYQNIPILSKPSPGILQGEDKICVHKSPNLQVAGEVLVAGPELDFYQWEVWNADKDSWQIVAETQEPIFQPEPQTEDLSYRSTTIARFKGLSSKSVYSNTITVATKICQVASNPMMRMQALKPAEE